MRRRFPFHDRNGQPFPGGRRPLFEARLKQAHAFFDEGHFLESAAIFEELAAIAAGRQGPRAPRFFIQAGRGYIHAGESDKGIALVQKGLLLLQQSGRLDAANIINARVQAELETLGLEGKITQLPPVNLSAPLSNAPKHPALPLKCPFCGGSVHPDEVEWLDENTAECEYCGSPIRG